MTFHVPNNLRLRTGPFASTEKHGNNGVFFLPLGKRSENGPLRAIASDGEGWEHVSVSLPHRYPTWEEMCVVKSLFWDEEDCVVQFHPPKSQYINFHPFCLRLWRPIGGGKFELPPTWMVGPKEAP